MILSRFDSCSILPFGNIILWITPRVPRRTRSRRVECAHKQARGRPPRRSSRNEPRRNSFESWRIAWTWDAVRRRSVTQDRGIELSLVRFNVRQNFTSAVRSRGGFDFRFELQQYTYPADYYRPRCVIDARPIVCKARIHLALSRSCHINTIPHPAIEMSKLRRTARRQLFANTVDVWALLIEWDITCVGNSVVSSRDDSSAVVKVMFDSEFAYNYSSAIVARHYG